MNINDAINDEQIKVTERTIEVAGVYISLFRPAQPVSDGAGGFEPADVPDSPLPAVKRLLAGLTMIGRGINQDPERYMMMTVGRRWKELLVMVGMPDDDVEVGDWFLDDNGNRCEVVQINGDRRYQTKCSVLVTV